MQYKLDAGIELGLFDNRVSMEFDVYRKKTVDMLLAAPLPTTSGYSSITRNIGSMENRGIEFAINTTNIKTADFSWSSQFNISVNKNRVLALTGGSDIYSGSTVIRVGESVGSFFGRVHLGTWSTQEKDLAAVYKARPGDVKYLDLNNDKQINDNDRTIIGNGVPKYVLGLNQTFRYKNFDLNILFRGKFGFDILNLQEVFFGNRKYLPNNIYNSTFTRHAALNDNPQYSDYYLEKGDFLKLDNVTLGYNFPAKGKYLRNLRAFVSGRNLLTITGYDGLDPELQDTGFETGVDARGFYPRTRSWTVGLNVGF